MPRFRRISVFLVLALALPAVDSLIARASPQAAPPSIVVKLRSADPANESRATPMETALVTMLSDAAGVSLTRGAVQRGGGQVLTLPAGFDATRLDEILATLRENEGVLYADVLPGEEFNPKAQASPASSSEDQRLVSALIVRLRAADDSGRPTAPSRLDDNVIQDLSSFLGASMSYSREMAGGFHLLALGTAVPFERAQLLATRLEQHPVVESADPDSIVEARLVPNDDYYPYQWHYFEDVGGIHLPTAWDVTTGSPATRVAVIDTGIRFDHPDFAGRTVGGYDFVSPPAVANDGDGRDSNPSDPGDGVFAGQCGAGSPARDSSWHGTHVAGTIGASTNDSYGVAGINWVSPIVPVRVLGRCGGTAADIADAIRWAAGGSVPGVPGNGTPARVLNLSLGTSVPAACPVAVQSAIDSALGAGAVVVVSAGNEASSASNYWLANCNGVIAVHATTRLGDDATYSNVGSVVDISAPGGDTSTPRSGPLGFFAYDGVLSDLNTGALGPVAPAFQWYQGTSMAAPHVSGVASLLLSVNPGLTPSQVLNRMQLTASPFPAGGYCARNGGCGSGIVNAAAAVSTPRSRTCTPSSTTLCAQGGRFRVTVSWRDLSGVAGEARLASVFANSGVFYFYGPDNAELLVKVLNGCGDPTFRAYWVFAAAATNFPFTIRVEDLSADIERTYSNPSGHTAETVTDVSAFLTCP